MHSARSEKGLAYREELEARCDEQFIYLPTVTREAFKVQQRGADLFRSGELYSLLDLPPADPEQDRVMLCGNPHMNQEMTEHLQQCGWTMTNYQGPGSFTVEQAFVLQDNDS